jgi:hypothetical protein
MDISYIILEVVWLATETFFVFSLLLLGALLIIKTLFERKKNFIQEKQLEYMYHQLHTSVVLSTDIELIAYSKMIGMRLLSTRDIGKREEIKFHIEKLNLYDRLYTLYQKTKTYRNKLYLFSTLVLFADARIEDECQMLIKNKKLHKKMPEFRILSIFGIALSAQTKEDLYELYILLSQMDEEEYLTQKFSEFFFIQAYVSVKEEEIEGFLKIFKPEKFGFISYALIYALQSLPSSHKVYMELLNFHNNYTSDDALIVAILRVQSIWKIKNEDLLLKSHHNKNDLVRIVCAKVGAQILESSNYHLLSHYCCDENPFVRKNFLLTLSEWKISENTLVSWVEETYDTCTDDPLFHKSLKLYEKGVA